MTDDHPYRQQKEITFVVPCYNSAEYMDHCIDSILHGRGDIEIIIVNDGSTDGTDRLCHTLASEYPCIHVITQKNAGICAARNRGMEAASGEYITFCDDDDLFWQGALHLLLQTAEDTRADLVRGDLAVADQPDVGRRGGGQLVQPVVAVEDQSTGAPAGQDARDQCRDLSTSCLKRRTCCGGQRRRAKKVLG